MWRGPTGCAAAASKRPITTRSAASRTATWRAADVAMLVYGDRSERADPRERLEWIAVQLAHVDAMHGGIERHARLVGALIEAGRLLQGVADADFDHFGQDRRTPAVDALTRYVCAIARATCRSWDSGFSRIDELPMALPQARSPPELALRTPEGFAYYAVYPEAYIEAARRLTL